MSSPARDRLAPTDSIRLTGLRAVAHHGVYAHERENGQAFVIDLTVWIDLSPAAASDTLDLTIDYGSLANEVVSAVESDPVDLIETVAERIAAIVLEHPAAHTVEVTVHKPGAPIAVPFDDVAVRIIRGRR